MTDARLLLGDWRRCLDVEAGSQISDPPFGERTHDGHNAGSLAAINGFEAEIDYRHWTPDDVHEFTDYWSPRTAGWMVNMTSHDLIPAWEAAYAAAKRYCFAPLPYVDFGKDPRVLGDGPASWSCYIMVARPKSKAWLTDWRARRVALGLPRSLPGAYQRRPGDVVWTPPARFKGKRIGGKPLGLMRELVADYSMPGDLVVDPCAGHGTTLRACQELGRDAIGCEVDRAAWEAGAWRLAQPVQIFIAPPRVPDYEQLELGSRHSDDGVRDQG